MNEGILHISIDFYHFLSIILKYDMYQKNMFPSYLLLTTAFMSGATADMCWYIPFPIVDDDILKKYITQYIHHDVI